MPLFTGKNTKTSSNLHQQAQPGVERNDKSIFPKRNKSPNCRLGFIVKNELNYGKHKASFNVGYTYALPVALNANSFTTLVK